MYLEDHDLNVFSFKVRTDLQIDLKIGFANKNKPKYDHLKNDLAIKCTLNSNNTIF